MTDRRLTLTDEDVEKIAATAFRDPTDFTWRRSLAESEQFWCVRELIYSLREARQERDAARAALRELEGLLLYCPPRSCRESLTDDGRICEHVPGCTLRQRSYEEASACLRRALGESP